jgi:CheY-like chemotaxis protein
MEAVGQLAGGVAHDFNNLLTIIRGNVELAEQALTGNTLPVEELVEVRRASDRAAALVRQLLAFSRRQPVQLQLTDVNDVLRDLHEMLTRLIGETIALETTLAPGLPPVLLDAGALQQVVMNLVVNARDAMPDGGAIRISTALDRDARGRPVRITVKDSGLGMSEEVRARAFEPFFTTKEVGKGTGLGLAVVYGIVTHADGDITIDSTEGRGTAIHIHLPVSRTPRERMATPVAHPRLPGNESLLVVEDEPAVRQFTVNVLQQLGYQVTAVADGLEALGVLDGGHVVDAIVTDVVMPEMGGPALIRTLAESGRTYPVVFMSGYTSDGVALEDLMTERSCFLSKPFGPADLGAAVRRVLDPIATPSR